MKLKNVNFQFNKVESVRRLPGTWQASEYRQLLKSLEVEDIDSYSDSDLEEVVIMSLQDLGYKESVGAVLSFIKEDQFTAGQIQNLIEELKEEAAWDEYSDISDHRALYISLDLLSAAFPEHYLVPSHTHLQIEISSEGLDSALAKHDLENATLLRGIAKGEESRCLLNRLFPDQIMGSDFPEADSIIWSTEQNANGTDSVLVDCHASAHWFKGLDQGMTSSIDIAWE